jgi:hypothetical protein
VKTFKLSELSILKQSNIIGFCAVIFWLSAALVGFEINLNYALAQNLDRPAEEQQLDKQRDEKFRQYLESRKTEENKILEQPISTEEQAEQNLVEVEPNNILPSDLATSYGLVPYNVRRQRWGQLYSVNYSFLNPVNFQSDVTGILDFDTAYGSAESRYIEFAFCYKWNFALGSLGAETSYGTYSNDGESSLIGDAKLNLQYIRLGARYTADNIFYEPKIAPYFLGGIYEVLYKETQSNITTDGTTFPAPYYGAGVLLQLNWLDKNAAIDSYTESGIENTYIFLEARRYLASNKDADPDFSTDVDFGFGLSLEF